MVCRDSVGLNRVLSLNLISTDRSSDFAGSAIDGNIFFGKVTWSTFKIGWSSKIYAEKVDILEMRILLPLVCKCLVEDLLMKQVHARILEKLHFGCLGVLVLWYRCLKMAHSTNRFTFNGIWSWSKWFTPHWICFRYWFCRWASFFIFQ